jgi:hypothetical protein
VIEAGGQGVLDAGFDQRRFGDTRQLKGKIDEEMPLLIEIIDRQGQVISSAEVALAAPALGELGTFEATLDYTVPYPQYGWVAVTERGLHPPAVLHYTSVRVYLRP